MGHSRKERHVDVHPCRSPIKLIGSVLLQAICSHIDPFKEFPPALPIHCCITMLGNFLGSSLQ